MSDQGQEMTPAEQRLTEDFYPAVVDEDEEDFLTDEELSQVLQETAFALEDISDRLARVESELGL